MQKLVSLQGRYISHCISVADNVGKHDQYALEMLRGNWFAILESLCNMRREDPL